MICVRHGSTGLSIDCVAVPWNPMYGRDISRPYDEDHWNPVIALFEPCLSPEMLSCHKTSKGTRNKQALRALPAATVGRSAYRSTSRRAKHFLHISPSAPFLLILLSFSIVLMR